MRLSKRPKGLSLTTLNETLVATLYNTNIIIKTADAIKLNSGGWLTMHTKKCLNLISQDLGLGFSVSQVKGQWYVKTANSTVPFQDNMFIKVG